MLPDATTDALPQIICIGNATEDVFLQVADSKVFTWSDCDGDVSYLALEYGAKLKLADLLISTGGGATNCAVTFARMGMRAAIVCKVGSDGPGERVAAAMQAEGIDCSHLVRDGLRRTGYSAILMGYTHDRTILTYRGAGTYLAAEDIHWDDLQQAEWVYIGSLTGDSAPLVHDIARFCGEHKIKLAINPGGDQRKAGMAGMADIFANTTALFLNKAEAYELTCVEPDRGQCDEAEMLNMLRDAGCQTVVMTCGADGSEGQDATGHYCQPALPANTISTVGAGDAYCAACTVALQKGLPLPEAMRVATANSASVVEHIGAKAGILTWEAAVARANA